MSIKQAEYRKMKKYQIKTKRFYVKFLYYTRNEKRMSLGFPTTRENLIDIVKMISIAVTAKEGDRN